MAVGRLPSWGVACVLTHLFDAVASCHECVSRRGILLLVLAMSACFDEGSRLVASARALPARGSVAIRSMLVAAKSLRLSGGLVRQPRLTAVG